MIVTLTANPSLDRTVALPGPLLRGEVQRAISVRQESGGKGVNVSRALVASGLKTIAVLPGAEADPVLAGLRETDVPFAALPIGEPLRSNVALTEPGGVTTKINEPGPVLSGDQQEALISLLLDHARGAAWVVLAGSLHPGFPPTSTRPSPGGCAPCSTARPHHGLPSEFHPANPSPQRSPATPRENRTS